MARGENAKNERALANLRIRTSFERKVGKNATMKLFIRKAATTTSTHNVPEKDSMR